MLDLDVIGLSFLLWDFPVTRWGLLSIMCLNCYRNPRTHKTYNIPPRFHMSLKVNNIILPQRLLYQIRVQFQYQAMKAGRFRAKTLNLWVNFFWALCLLSFFSLQFLNWKFYKPLLSKTLFVLISLKWFPIGPKFNWAVPATVHEQRWSGENTSDSCKDRSRVYNSWYVSRVIRCILCWVSMSNYSVCLYMDFSNGVRQSLSTCFCVGCVYCI